MNRIKKKIVLSKFNKTTIIILKISIHSPDLQDNDGGRKTPVTNKQFPIYFS